MDEEVPMMQLGTGGAMVASIIMVGGIVSGCAADPRTASQDPSTGSSPAHGSTDEARGYTSLAGSDVVDPLPPGSYGFLPIGASAEPVLVVTVPEGYRSDGPVLYPVVDGGVDPLDRGLSLWIPTDVYRDACDTDAGFRDTGTTPSDLARALVAQRHSEATRPRAVTVGGYDALYLELTAPTDIDYATCGGQVDYWECGGRGTRHVEVPGMVDRMWVLQVGEERVILGTAAGPGATPAQVAALTGLAESAGFVLD
jgi:hypothetical protein